jgi:hypothetical protein
MAGTGTGFYSVAKFHAPTGITPGQTSLKCTGTSDRQTPLADSKDQMHQGQAYGNQCCGSKTIIF